MSNDTPDDDDGFPDYEALSEAMHLFCNTPVPSPTPGAVRRIGPDTPDKSMVICPHCTSQFGAISMDDQRYRNGLEHSVEILTAQLSQANAALAREQELHRDACQRVCERDLQLSQANARVAELQRLLKYAIDYSSARSLFPDGFIEDARAALPASEVQGE
jgi:hypothetical protein